MGYSAEKWCKTQWRDGGGLRTFIYVTTTTATTTTIWMVFQRRVDGLGYVWIWISSINPPRSPSSFLPPQGVLRLIVPLQWNETRDMRTHRYIMHTSTRTW